MKQVCKKCKSSDIEYWDNVELTSQSYDWGFYCNGCKEYLDPYDGIETVEEVDEQEHK